MVYQPSVHGFRSDSSTAMKKRRAVLVCLAVVLIGGLALALSGRNFKRRADAVNCGNYMASIGLSAKTWALDNERRLPSDFRSMSNELATTRILICPGDRWRKPSDGWISLDQTNCSYEIVAPGLSVDDTTNVYFRCKVHGHLGYSDGTVFDGSRRRTKILW